MRGCFALLAAVVAVFVAPSAAAAADLACGDVVMADVVLQADLVGCSTGLVVGADNVTIDLNGHTIDGQSTLTGAGVEAVGRSGVRVVNGRIRSFALGVFLLDTTESSVARLDVRDTDIGISVSGGERSFESSGRKRRRAGRTRESSSSRRRPSWPRTGSPM